MLHLLLFWMMGSSKPATRRETDSPYTQEYRDAVGDLLRGIGNLDGRQVYLAVSKVRLLIKTGQHKRQG